VLLEGTAKQAATAAMPAEVEEKVAYWVGSVVGGVAAATMVEGASSRQ
jgi:myosin-crossreactive antigen